MSFSYGKVQRREAYEKLNKANSEDLTMVSIGCPHYSLHQLTKVAGLLEGKKVNDKVLLLIYTDRQLKTVADRSGYTDIINRAGGHLMVDSCPLNMYLPTSNVIATDSSKTAHYLAGMRGYDNVWYGTMEECIQASIIGKWKGELK